MYHLNRFCNKYNLYKPFKNFQMEKAHLLNNCQSNKKISIKMLKIQHKNNNISPIFSLSYLVNKNLPHLFHVNQLTARNAFKKIQTFVRILFFQIKIIIYFRTKRLKILPSYPLSIKQIFVITKKAKIIEEREIQQAQLFV